MFSPFRAYLPPLFSNLINKMHFPVEDIVTNFRHFITSVKRATGNAKDPDAVDRKLNSGGARPGMNRLRPSLTMLD